MELGNVKDEAEIAKFKIHRLLYALGPQVQPVVAIPENITTIQKSLSGIDCDQLYETLQKLLLPEEADSVHQIPLMEIPASLLCRQDDVIELLDEVQLKSLLGTGKYAVNVSFYSTDNKIYEEVDGESCSIDSKNSDDVGSFGRKEGTDQRSRQHSRGEREYARISQQIVQAILSSDLNIDVGNAMVMAANAILISVSWLSSGVPRLQCFNALRKIFGDLRYELKQQKQKIQLLDMKIGNGYWDDNHYGLGMLIHTEITVDIHADSDSEKNTSCLLTSHCLIKQAIPLSTSSLYYESCRVQDSSGTVDASTCIPLESLLIDSAQNNLLISFYKPNYSGPFILPPNVTNSLNRGYKKRQSCGKSMKEIIAGLTNAPVSGIPMNSKLRNTEIVSNYFSNSDNPNMLSEIIFKPVSAREVINSVACSFGHILALTNFGLVYSSGDGGHGQLGHGSLDCCRHLQLITYFMNNLSENHRIVQISAGSGRFGSHSAAIDTKGHLYTWGKTMKCGHFPDIRSRMESLTLIPKRVNTLEKYGAIKVSCGADHTIVLTRSRDSNDAGSFPSKDTGSTVFSWGIIANGRLGLGRPKAGIERGFWKMKKTNNNQIWESKPKVISSLNDEEIVDVAAGKSHSLAISKDGRIFSWGSNSFGQCGIVSPDKLMYKAMHERKQLETHRNIPKDKMQGIWDDIWIPRQLSEFGPETGVYIKCISAGGQHSAAIDDDGRVYTWGGGGDSYCLGHGHCNARDIHQKYGIDSASDSSRRRALVMAGHLMIPSWGSPRAVDCMKQEKIRAIDLGVRHGAAISESGKLYVWGEKMAKLPMTSQEEDFITKSVRSSIPSVPITFSDADSNVFGHQYVSNVACGMDSTFFISSNDYHGNSVGKRLYHVCYNALKSSDQSNEENSLDCILITVGGKLYCHRVVVAHRSSVLDQMLTMEERPQDSSKYVTLYVPGIRNEVMKQILCFIYTDRIPNFQVSSFDSLLQLWEAASALKIEYLMTRCKAVLEADHGYSVGPPDKSSMDQSIMTHTKSLPSFGSDMRIALQEGRFSDVHIVVEGKTIFAHQCILSAASEYFATVLEMTNGNERGSKKILDLPGSHASVMRLLSFLYSGTLPSTSQNELIEDIENAHRYKLHDMLSLCESAIQVTPANACEMLLLAIQVQSSRLRLLSMQIIANTLEKQFADESTKQRFETTMSQCPIGVKDELFELIKARIGIGSILPADRKILAEDTLKRYHLEKSSIESQMANELLGLNADGLSTKSIMMLLILLALYVYLQQYSFFRASVPVINCLVLAITCIYLFRRI